MGTVFAGDPILAADVNKAALGRIAQTTPTTNTATLTTTETAIDAVTASLVNGYRYRVMWAVNFLGSVVADRFLMRIREDSGVAGNQLSYSPASIIATSGSSAIGTLIVVAEYTATATASKTFTGTAVRDSGTGNVSLRGSANQPRFLSIDYLSGA